MYRYDPISTNINYPLENYFIKDCRGEWSVKIYVPRCEFCGELRCDRMEEKEDLEDMIEDLRLDGSMQNNEKRYKISREWIRFKYGG